MIIKLTNYKEIKFEKISVERFYEAFNNTKNISIILTLFLLFFSLSNFVFN
jgi:hypothetical protein